MVWEIKNKLKKRRIVSEYEDEQSLVVCHPTKRKDK